ncbi:MAG: ABC transporter substrate-binding protein [Candidatus Binatia bacterium]
MARLITASIILTLLFTQAGFAQAPKLHRIGVVHPGGGVSETLEGLRQGLRELGLEEGKQFQLIIKDVEGDALAVEEVAKTFEKNNAALIYALTTQVIAKAKAATNKVPIVFTIGSDPVGAGLVESFAKPGGRLTGVHYLARDLTAKRLEILKEILPKIGRVLTFYDPTNKVAADGATLARDEAKRIGIKLIERHVGSVDELKNELQKLKAGEADAFLYSPDPMIGSQAQLLIDVATAKKMPTMFQDQSLVAKGALAGYGQNYREIGRVSAKYVQRVLGGAQPKDLKIETVDSVELAINLQTAKRLGVTIPPQVLARAQKVFK